MQPEERLVSWVPTPSLLTPDTCEVQRVEGEGKGAQRCLREPAVSGFRGWRFGAQSPEFDAPHGSFANVAGRPAVSSCALLCLSVWAQARLHSLGAAFPFKALFTFYRNVSSSS